MKKVLLFAAVLGLTSLGYKVMAQDEKPELKEKKELAEKKELKEIKEKKETQEIIIRKKGDKETRLIVEIQGDKITINGKPMSEFKDGDITINKRNIMVWDGKNNYSFSPVEDMEMIFDGKGFGDFKTMEDKPRAFLGVTTNTTTDNSKEAKPNGAEITNVSKGSAAEKAGLKEGDVITKINSTKIDSPDALAETVGNLKPKDEVTVYYKRDGKEMQTKAILGETKTTMAYSFSGPDGNMRSLTIPRAPMAPRMPAMPNFEWNGKGNFDLDEITLAPFPRQKLGLKIQDIEEGEGVKILNVDKESPAEKAGLQKDDIVTEIAGKKITNTDDAREQLHENAEKSSYNIKAKRNGKEMSFDIKIPKKLKTANL